MLVTKECDYALRIIRSLYKNNKANVQSISNEENMSIQITYKLAKKLENAGIIQSFRGVYGGYSLKAPLEDLTLYDVFMAVDKELFLTDCTNDQYQCPRNTCSTPCAVHREFCRIQKVLDEEMKAKSILEILQ